MISSVIIASGECKKLPDLLSEVLLSFNEVIVIDNGISAEVIRNPLFKKAKVFKEKTKDFSTLRNFAMTKAKNDWVFFIDTDEKPEDGLLKEIKGKIKNTQYVAFYVKRREFFQGKEVKFGEVWKSRTKGIIRLIKKGKGKWKGKVHEVFIPAGKVGKVNKSLLHYSHESIIDFLEKINFYSSLRAKELYELKVKFNFFELLFLPFFKFIYTYFFLLGFLDGAVGFIYSFMMSFHSFLVRAKLYQYRDFK